MSPDEITLDDQQLGVIDELEQQAQLFDLEIDWETGSIVAKRPNLTPQWLRNWKNMLSDSDKQADHVTQAWEAKE